MIRYFKTIWVLCVMLTKRWFRDPVALFFTFLFPLIFLFVFGSLFRSGGDISFEIAVVNNSDHQFAAQFEQEVKSVEVFRVADDVTGMEEARDKMGQDELGSIVELPSTFGALDAEGAPRGDARVYYKESNPELGQTIATIVRQALDEASVQITGESRLFDVELTSATSEGLSRFDYLMAGLMGFTILTLAIFGMGAGFPADKKTGSLRRLRATPLRASQLMLATALEYMMIGLLSMGMMLAVGMLLFDFQMRGSFVTLAAFSIVGIFCLFGFGLAIGGWAKNENQAAPLSNLVAFPMMFLSGVFFPIFLMPYWLQNIAGFLPLTPVIDGIRQIITENASLFDLGSEFAIIAVWIAIIYALAAKVFRWE